MGDHEVKSTNSPSLNQAEFRLLLELCFVTLQKNRLNVDLESLVKKQAISFICNACSISSCIEDIRNKCNGGDMNQHELSLIFYLKFKLNWIIHKLNSPSLNAVFMQGWHQHATNSVIEKIKLCQFQCKPFKSSENVILKYLINNAVIKSHN